MSTINCEETPTHTSVEEHLGFYCRIMDDVPIDTWDFDTIYNTWKQLGYFKPLSELGFVKVSYNTGDIDGNCDNDNYIDFVPSITGKNRHQALALAAFIRGRNSDSIEIISCRHEKGGTFCAQFARITTYLVHYISEWNATVKFKFDPTIVSQFA